MLEAADQCRLELPWRKADGTLASDLVDGQSGDRDLPPTGVARFGIYFDLLTDTDSTIITSVSIASERAK